MEGGEAPKRRSERKAPLQRERERVFKNWREGEKQPRRGTSQNKEETTKTPHHERDRSPETRGWMREPEGMIHQKEVRGKNFLQQLKCKCHRGQKHFRTHPNTKSLKTQPQTLLISSHHPKSNVLGSVSFQVLVSIPDGIASHSSSPVQSIVIQL